MKKMRRIVLAAALCMVIGLQGMIPVSAAEKGTVETRSLVCPNCGGRVNVSDKTETTCSVQECPEHLNCVIHVTTVTTYRIKSCSDCGDYSKSPLKSETTYNHLIG